MFPIWYIKFFAHLVHSGNCYWPDMWECLSEYNDFFTVYYHSDSFFCSSFLLNSQRFWLLHLILFFPPHWKRWSIDPLGRLTVTAGSDHCFSTCCPSVPTTFQNLAKQNKLLAKTMFTTGETVGLAEWIIEKTWSILSLLSLFYTCRKRSKNTNTKCSKQPSF